MVRVGCVCCPASDCEPGMQQAPERGDTNPGHERGMALVMFAPDRQTQIFNGQNGKEITVFPFSSKHKPHESQELQRGFTAGCEPVVHRCCPSPKA